MSAIEGFHAVELAITNCEKHISVVNPDGSTKELLSAKGYRLVGNDERGNPYFSEGGRPRSVEATETWERAPTSQLAAEIEKALNTPGWEVTIEPNPANVQSGSFRSGPDIAAATKIGNGSRVVTEVNGTVDQIAKSLKAKI